MDNIKEKKEIQLIIDNKDVIVKQFVAGIWPGPDMFSGFNYHTSLKIDGVLAYGKDKIPLTTSLSPDRHNIEVLFSTPIPPGNKYVYEMQILLNRAQMIQNLGSLNIIEWPKEDLGEIIFLRNAGQIFFSSALAKIVNDISTQQRKIIPGSYARRLISHANSASGIRIEWGIPPKFKIKFRYDIKNTGKSLASNISISSYIPPPTKFQKIKILNFENTKISKDNDENTLVNIDIGNLNRGETQSISYFEEIYPKGNTSVLLPVFGKFDEYQRLTQSNSLGAEMISSSKYWPISDTGIQQLYQALKNNSKNASEYIKLAFEFVNQKIKYEINGFRDDAANTFRIRSGDCSEFSDLFVCLLRAAKIPAKIVHGWTIDIQNYNKLEPHAWCEFFAPENGGWRQCDPTWGFLTGVSSQHICRQREGILKDQFTYSWKFTGNTELEITEEVSIEII